MEHFQYTNDEELNLSKKIYFENEQLRSRVKYLLIASFISMFLVLISTLGTVRDYWICELDEHNRHNSVICKELRRAVNCKTTIAPPIRAEVILRINNTIKASALAFCGWDTAISEIRTCFCILSLIIVYFAWNAISTQSKKLAEIFQYSSVFFAVLMIISALFDYISILDSKVNNYNLCNLTDEFAVEKNVNREMVECNYNSFYVTIIFSLCGSIFLLLSSQYMAEWKKTVQDDNY